MIRVPTPEVPDIPRWHRTLREAFPGTRPALYPLPFPSRLLRAARALFTTHR